MKMLQAYHTVRLIGLTFWLGCTLVAYSPRLLAEPLPIIAPNEILKPFTTDGCSLFPDGVLWDTTLWRECCVAHDMAYWKGGDFWERLAADEALWSCVDHVGEPAMGVVMLLGVRLGGSPLWPTPFKWGYGWPSWRGYKALTFDELKRVENRLIEQQLLKPSYAQSQASKSHNKEDK